MTNRKQHIYYLLLLVALSLVVTLTNLGVKKSFIGDDAGVRYSYPDVLLQKTWNMWNETVFPGILDVISSTQFIFNHIVVFSYSLGFNDIFLSRFFYFMFFFLSGSGVYILFQALYERDKYNPLAGFIAATIYSFNYFTTVQVSFPLSSYHISYCLFPWVFFLIVKVTKNPSSYFLIFITSLVLLLFFSGNPANTISSLVFIGIWALVFNQDVKLKVGHYIIFGLTVLLLSSHIIFPLFSISVNPYTNITPGGNEDSLRFNSMQTSFLNLFRFQGFHSTDSFIFNKLLALNPLFILASFTLPLIVIFSFVFRSTNKVQKFYFAMFIILILLAKGVHEPFADLFEYVFNKIFIFQMFRSTYTKFIPLAIFSLAMLIGQFVIEIQNHSSNFNKRLLLGLIIFGISVNSIPLLTGQVARDFHLAKIPNEYNEAKFILNQSQSGFSILGLPQIKGAILKWGKDDYYAGQFYQDSYFLGHPVWSVSWFNPALSPYFSDESRLEDGLKLIRFYSIKYILLHKDIPEDYQFVRGFQDSLGGVSMSKKMDKILKQNPNIKIILTNDHFDLYEINDANYMNPLFIPPIVSLRTLDADPNENINYLLENDHNQSTLFSLDEGVLLSELEQKISVLKNLTAIKSSFLKITPSKYELKVLGATNTLPLILNASFNSSWELYLAKGDDFGKGNDFDTISPLRSRPTYKLDSQTQLLANGYANGWLLNVNEACSQSNLCIKNADGTYSFVIFVEFGPQKYFVAGLIVSLSVFILGLLYIVIDLLLRFRKQKLLPISS